jgi:hypothetical protein
VLFGANCKKRAQSLIFAVSKIVPALLVPSNWLLRQKIIAFNLIPMNLYTRFTLFLLLLLLSACQFGAGNKPRSIEAYYFPVDALSEGLVYEYRGKDPADPPFYWYFRSFLQDTADFLTSTYYDYNFNPFQLIREERMPDGMIIRESFLYETDSLGYSTQVVVQVPQASQFPFLLYSEHPVVVQESRWSMPADSGAVTTLLRNRQFMGDTTVYVDGQLYDAVKFYVRELIDINKEGHMEYEYDGEELYAKGIGLVFTERRIAEGFTTSFYLTKRYPMTELEALFGKAQENKSQE